ncbi:hypothetical protein H6P81_013992 [Aristolochia fimbriata]|uniref:BCNT-C domain-containing protein n=1 Tax=Aristolochia fimbriata TaxID=158543 RepID=A0AAV7EHU8_ARIFI|nr:hypothetical protein H6P81_013992 [Aristolochia fimbriata]
MASNGSPDPVNVDEENGVSSESSQEVKSSSSAQEDPEEIGRKARVNAAWEQMNSGVPLKMPKFSSKKSLSTGNKASDKSIPSWMVTLGLAPRRPSIVQDLPQTKPSQQNGTEEEEVKRLAAAALSAAKDASLAAGKGKVEITEVRDFAGEDIEVKKFVDADSKEAAEKAKPPTGPPTALDAILEQMKKKQKLSVLDKTKKDWGEFKDENKGLEEELDAYKKSSNQYLDRVSFLQRTDMREFERERDARLALQSKRGRSDMREDP